MKYGKELIKQAKQEAEEANQQIEALEVEVSKIKSDIEEREEDYSVKAVRERSDLMTELKNFEESLQRAKASREKELKEKTPDYIKEAVKIMKQAQAKGNEKNQKNVDQIEKNILEIVALYQDTKELDDQIHSDLKTFLNSLFPHLSKEKQDKNVKNLHRNKTPKNIFSDELRKLGYSASYDHNVLNTYELEDTDLFGLLPPSDELVGEYEKNKK